MTGRIAYMPLNTYPEALPDAAILSALELAPSLATGLHASVFAVDIPPVTSPFGEYLINVESLARAAEDRSRAEARRLIDLVEGATVAALPTATATHRALLGAVSDAAATEARYYDLALVPWAAGPLQSQDIAQALVFGSGLPVVLVPAGARGGRIDHVAIAWDESRVAARALADALPLLAPGGRVSVLTVRDEKKLRGPDLARTLASALARRGHDAHPVEVALGGRPVAVALQAAAAEQGARLLAMGAFGHSRLREFILGGATRGVLADLHLPVLMAH